MKVLTVKPFLDLKEGVERKEGDVFTASKARFAEICEALPGFVSDADAGKEEDGE